MTQMTDNTIEKILEQMGKTYRSWKPRQQRVETTWNFLVQELNTVEAPVAATPIFSFPSFAWFFHLPALRPVLAVLVLSIFSVGSLLKVASASLPGDALYTVKLVREQALVRLAVDETARTKLAVQFAVNRADEVRQVVAREEPREQKAQRVALAVAGLQAQVNTATDALATTVDKKELTGLMREGAQQIVTLLNDAKNEAEKNNGIVAKEVNTVFAAMSETQALVAQSENPPTTLSLSVPIEVAAVMKSDFPKEVRLRQIEIVRRPVSLVNPAQSVSSLPIAQGVASGENLPIATSIGSAP